MVLKTVSTLGGGGGGGGGGGTPGGANNTIQFNNAGAFAGSANLTWDGANVQVGSSGRIKLSNGVTNYVGFNAPTIIPANVTWTLPSTDGATGNFLITNGSGTLSWAAANLTPIAPSNYSLPVVSGNTTVGQTLSSTTGGWNGYPAPTYAYQWVRGASNIANATSATYPLVDADYNNTIKVIVIASNSAGNATANSVATANIAGTVPGAPTIGTATAGNAQASVSFTANAVTGGPNVTIYTATSSPGNITGTNNVSPVTVSGLTNGNSYTFTVTATNIIGTSLPSAASNSVTPTPAPITDSSFAYVPLLLETTSTNGQQNNTFLDSSSNTFTITRNGTPTQGSITPYWPNGQWSNYFNGSTDYLSTPYDSSFVFGTNDFTVECWIYITNNPALRAILSLGYGANGTGPVTSTWQLRYWGTENSNQIGFNRYDGTTSTDYITSGAPIVANGWYHIAVSRTGGTLKIFVNGVSYYSAANTFNYTAVSTSDPFLIGLGYYGPQTGLGGPRYFPGYISNVRIVNGTGVYSSNFTLPTAPLTATQSANVNGNPSAAITGTQTKLLTCYSNRFIDANTAVAAKTITVGGIPTVQAFQPFSPAAAYTPAAYGGSGYFNGTSDWLSILDNAAFALGSGDFTAECWIYPTSIANEAIIMGQWSGDLGGSGLNFALLFSSGSTGYLRLITSSNGSSVLFDLSTSTTSFSISLNTWQHIAAVRSGSTFTLYVNGVSRATTTNASALFDATNAFTIGAESNTQGQYFTGYISNARLAKGTAVYTGAFTPPTLAPLTTAGSTSAASYSSTTNVNTSFADSSTSLLLNMTNAGIYDAAVQNVITTVADAQVSSTITPKWGTTSMKFDGTGDWLTAIDSPQLQIGTGDFTIDGWVYLSANGIVYGIVSKGTATTGWSVNVTVLNKLQFSYTTFNLTGTTSLATGTWYYFAVVRSGSATGNLKLYLNASLEATSGGAVTDNFNQTSILYVGADRIGTSALNGYLQDVRVTKAARTITLPTASFPVQ